MVPSWTLDELDHAGPEHLDPEFVAGYDRKGGYSPSDDLAVLRGLGLDDTKTLVDLGAGTGALAVAAAREFGHVVAVDVSPAMLHFLRERAAEAGVRNLDSVRAGFLSYEHVGPLAHAVYTRNALHHLPDFWKALALTHIAQILRPGGFLLVRDLIYDFEPTDAEHSLERWLDGAADDAARGYTRDELAEHVRCEYSTYHWLFEPMLAAAGFEIVSAEYRRSVYASYTCVKH